MDSDSANWWSTDIIDISPGTIRYRGGFDRVAGVDRPVRLARTGLKMDGQSPTTPTPPPSLGAHTEEILSSLGYDTEAIEALRREGAI